MTAIVQRVVLRRETVHSFGDYPFCIPAIKTMSELQFPGEVTFFVGTNGSGKSTLLEAIAIAAGFNAEGGTRNFNFETAKATSKLCDHIRLTRGTRREETGFFLRAESYFNLASEIESLDKGGGGRPIIDSYGGIGLHHLSHGESFMALVRHRFGSRGLYILDEPESALSPEWQLSLLRHMKDLTDRDSQFLIATHSPILLAYPGARIYRFGKDGIHQVEYQETDQYRFYSDFIQDPQRFLRYLFDSDA